MYRFIENYKDPQYYTQLNEQQVMEALQIATSLDLTFEFDKEKITDKNILDLIYWNFEECNVAGLVANLTQENKNKVLKSLRDVKNTDIFHKGRFSSIQYILRVVQISFAQVFAGKIVPELKSVVISRTGEDGTKDDLYTLTPLPLQ